jgi:hypothetical protein
MSSKRTKVNYFGFFSENGTKGKGKRALYKAFPKEMARGW